MMNKPILLSAILLASSPILWAFESGSDDSDGVLSPVISTQVAAKADGIYNFSSINIPAGVTISFEKNAANTPITLLVSGDVTVSGTINLNGGDSADVGAAGNGALGDDGLPGIGGPGGFDGGLGGTVANVLGAAGVGPGGGGEARGNVTGANVGQLGLGCGGGGAGFAENGLIGGSSSPTARDYWCDSTDDSGFAGQAYGNTSLLPLLGGSGGGGGSAGFSFAGSGGGGGGGSLLIAVSGTVTLNDNSEILANGGTSGDSDGSQAGGTGGGGSGGAVRIVATTISGNGDIVANGGERGLYQGSTGQANRGGLGAVGRIRLEGETITRTETTTPPFTVSEPQEVFLAGLPSLRITTVAGQAAPLTPTGNADITLAATEPNPVVIEFATTGVPLGSTISLTITPVSGERIDAPLSSALSGTVENATASTSVNLPDGPSVLLAEVSYQVTVAMGHEYSIFAEGEQVASVRLRLDPIKGALTTFITESGKEFTYPSHQVAS